MGEWWVRRPMSSALLVRGIRRTYDPGIRWALFHNGLRKVAFDWDGKRISDDPAGEGRSSLLWGEPGLRWVLRIAQSGAGKAGPHSSATPAKRCFAGTPAARPHALTFPRPRGKVTGFEHDGRRPTLCGVYGMAAPSACLRQGNRSSACVVWVCGG